MFRNWSSLLTRLSSNVFGYWVLQILFWHVNELKSHNPSFELIWKCILSAVKLIFDRFVMILGPKCIFLKHHMIYNTFYFLPWLRQLGVSSRNTTQEKKVTYTFPSGFQSCSPNPCKQAGTCELSRRGDAYCRWDHFFIEVSTDKLENLMTMLCIGYLLRKHHFNILDTFFPRYYWWSLCVEYDDPCQYYKGGYYRFPGPDLWESSTDLRLEGDATRAGGCLVSVACLVRGGKRSREPRKFFTHSQHRTRSSLKTP